MSELSQIQVNVLKDPCYRPYCMRCPGLVRMERTGYMKWVCYRCWAKHEEPVPAYGAYLYLHDVNGWLFQAAMWRRYAMDWGLPESNDRWRWVDAHLRLSRNECKQRAQIAVENARRLNQEKRALCSTS
jgi:hypothetical protein